MVDYFAMHATDLVQYRGGNHSSNNTFSLLLEYLLYREDFLKFIDIRII